MNERTPWVLERIASLQDDPGKNALVPTPFSGLSLRKTCHFLFLFLTFEVTLFPVFFFFFFFYLEEIWHPKKPKASKKKKEKKDNQNSLEIMAFACNHLDVMARGRWFIEEGEWEKQNTPSRETRQMHACARVNLMLLLSPTCPRQSRLFLLYIPCRRMSECGCAQLAWLAASK